MRGCLSSVRDRIVVSRLVAGSLAAALAFLAFAVAASGAWGAAIRPAGDGHRRVVLYDDFAGGAASYATKWLLFFSLEQQFGATNLPAFSHGRLVLDADPFRGWMDTGCVPGFQACVNADHVKYQAFSTTAFPVPRRGSVTVSADIEGRTLGTRPGYVVPATGRRLPEAHQAAAVMQLLDPTVGQTFDWFVSRHEAIPKIERTLAPVGSVGLDRAYTQFLDRGQDPAGAAPVLDPILARASEARRGGLVDRRPACRRGAPRRHPARRAGPRSLGPCRVPLARPG